MKRNIGVKFFVSIFTFLSLILPNGYADSSIIINQGILEGSIAWKIVENSSSAFTLTLTGSGAMPDWSIYDENEKAPWDEYKEDIVEISIGEGITTIGSKAFQNCVSARNVSFPNTLTRIGRYAFSDCSRIESLDFPSALTRIDNDAFSNCSSLTELSIPHNIEYLGAWSFAGCRKLISVTLPETLTELKDGVFAGCRLLPAIELPASLRSIGDNALASCDALKSISIPSSVSYINPAAFPSCTGLKEIYVSPDNQYYSSESGVLFTKDKRKLMLYPHAKQGDEYTVPSSVVEITGSAFAENKVLHSVHLPDTLTHIGDYAFGTSEISYINIPQKLQFMGFGTFMNCSGLKNCDLIIPGTIKEIGEATFASAAFHTMTIEEGVTRIENQAFSSLNYGPETSITLPASLKYIADNGIDKRATIYCYENSLADTWAQNNGNPIIYIGTYTPPEPSGEIIDSGAFNSILWELNNYGELTLTGSGAMPDWSIYDENEKAPWDEYKEDIVEISIGEGITTIGSKAFQNCVSARNVSFPNTLTRIGRYAFSDCSRIESLDFPSALTRIDNDAFSNCSSLTELSIPHNIEYLGAWSFAGCRKLISVTLPETLTELKDGVFAGCRLLPAIELPASLRSIGDNALASCDALKSISIPSSVSYINPAAFPSCTGLKEIYVSPDNQYYSSESGVLFTKDKRKLMLYPHAKQGDEYTVPSSVVEITGSAFAENKVLHSVHLPDTLTHIGDYAFGTSEISYINIPQKLQFMGFGTFMNCSGLKNCDLIIPGTIKEIGEATFASAAFHTMTIEEGVTRIENQAFSSLNYGPETSITLPASLKYIADNGIDKRITIRCHHDTIAETWASKNGNLVEYSCNISLSAKQATVLTDGYIGDACRICGYHEDDITTIHNDSIISIPTETKQIETESFLGSSAEQVNLPSGIMNIGNKAFANNSHLLLVVIPDMETTIETDAFYESPNVTIMCQAGSKAAIFAENFNIPYVTFK